MTNTPGQQTITPERQIAASQVGNISNSFHQYLNTLMHSNEAGEKLTSQPLEYARMFLEMCSFWAIKHVLMHGPVPQPAANDTPVAPPSETPAPIGTIDPPQDTQRPGGDDTAQSPGGNVAPPTV